jgi:hypothetical protein
MRLSIQRTPVIALAALTLAALLPASARAGSYVVTSCHGGGANAAWSASASAELAAYDDCPLDNVRPSASGMADRTVVQSSTATLPGFSYAKHHFEAPPGASLASVTFTAGFWVGSNPAADGWQAGLWGLGADGTATKRWGDCYYGQCTGAAYALGGPQTVDLAGSAAAEFLLVCTQLSCPAAATPDGFGGSGPRAWMNTGDVSVRVQDDTVPAFGAVSGDLWGDGWHRGAETVRYDLDDNVGIAATSLETDGVERTRHAIACDYTRARPCPSLRDDTYTLDTTGLSDGRHEAIIGAADAADNHSAAVHFIDVDNHAPAAPAGLTLAGGEGWRHAPGFSLGWTDPGDQVAPIVRASWTACRAPADCVSGEAAGDGIAALGDLAVPAPGDWTVRVRLADAAGNSDPASVSDPVHVRYDPAGPDRLGFAPRDATDPRRIEAVIGDSVSGPADGVIELRRSGAAGDWTPLATTFGAGRLVARVDDEGMAPGLYDGRVVAHDVAGNENISDRYADGDGGPFTISLPARTPTRVTTVPPSRTATYVAFGARSTISGRLTTATGDPVSGELIDVRAKGYSPLATELHVGVERSGADGVFSYTAPPGSSREVRFYYGGNSVLGPSRGTQRLLVRAALTLRADHRRVANGRSVLFTGRLRGGPVPPQGKLVNLQAFYRHKWRTFTTARTTHAGTFRARYRFEATYGRVVYKFRAMARREAAYPYELGVSPRVSVTVVGPR